MRSAAGSSELVPRTASLSCSGYVRARARTSWPSRRRGPRATTAPSINAGCSRARTSAPPTCAAAHDRLCFTGARRSRAHPRAESGAPAAGRAGAKRCEGLTPERAGAVVQLAEQAAEPRELAVRRREAASDRRQLGADTVAACAGDLAEAPLEAPPLGLEGERLRVAVGQRRLDRVEIRR